MPRASQSYLAQTRRVFGLLHYVSRHGGVTPRELCRELGVSAPTLFRLRLLARQAFGAQVVWDPDGQEYHVASWGVLDPTAVSRRLRAMQRRKP